MTQEEVKLHSPVMRQICKKEKPRSSASVRTSCCEPLRALFKTYLPDLAAAVPGLGARLPSALLSGRVAETGRALDCGVAVAPLYSGSIPGNKGLA